MEPTSKAYQRPVLLTGTAAFLALTGCGSLGLTGELNPVMMIPGLAALPGYYSAMRGHKPAPKKAVAGLSLLVTLVFIFDLLILSDDFLVAIAHMTLGFQAVKSFDLNEPWDYIQVFFMSLLQLIITSELTLSIVFAAIFVVFLAALMAAMVAAHFIKESSHGKIGLARPVIAVTVIAGLLTSVFFILIPRAGWGLFGHKAERGIAAVGFTESIEFGSFGTILQDPTVVMRVEVEGRRLPLLWRGMTLDHFDGFAWQDTVTKHQRVWRREGIFIIPGEERRFLESGEGELAIQSIMQEPMGAEVVFGLGYPVAVEMTGWELYTDGEGAVLQPFKKNRRVRYKVWSLPAENMKIRIIRPYLQYPAGHEVIAETASDITKNEPDRLKKAELIDKYLKTYEYSLIPPAVPAGRLPIEFFLSDSRKGFCEHYATSMVLMLRSLRIPARIVTGYKGGETDEAGAFITIRQSNAHSWVEALIDGKWRTFDPTPSAPESLRIPGMLSYYLDWVRMYWYRYVIGFSRTDQSDLASYMSGALSAYYSLPKLKFGISPIVFYAIALVSALSLGIMIKRILEKSKYTYESSCYIRYLKLIKKNGGRLSDSSAPSDLLQEAGRLGFGPEAGELVALYEKARFGGHELTGKERLRLQKLSSSLHPKSPTRGTNTQGV